MLPLVQAKEPRAGAGPFYKSGGTRQLVATLLAAIIPQPNLTTLSATAKAFYYRLRDPPRRRKLQMMPLLS
jgi:hypothetical protein